MLWLAFLMFIATPLGIFMAVLLDREVRGTRFYQTVFYLPVVLSLALIGFIWQLQYAPDNGFINSVLGASSSDGNRSTGWVIRPEHLGGAGRRQLAPGRLRDGPLPGRAQERRPVAPEAAAIDGASERQTFFRVVFPVMRADQHRDRRDHVIESLRAFDLAYIINGGRNGLELLSTLITNNSISEASLVGFGSAIAVVLLVISLVPDRHLSSSADDAGGARMTVTTVAPAAQATAARSRGGRRSRCSMSS